jgi:hypothetical protein
MVPVTTRNEFYASSTIPYSDGVRESGILRTEDKPEVDSRGFEPDGKLSLPLAFAWFKSALDHSRSFIKLSRSDGLAGI